MSIIEVLTVDVGSSVAKAILKVWLKDYGIASDVTSDLLDLLKSKTHDVVAQQRAKRQFEAIGEKVVENLIPLFEREQSKIDEGAQEAVALKIANILNNSRIDASLLAGEDLDPARLLAYLQIIHPKRATDLSRSEAEFLERILAEICRNIVDIASQLPSFNEHTLSEILKRESQLIEITNRILDDVRRMRRAIEESNSPDQTTQFETEYRRAIVRNLDEVELFGADVSAASKRHRISISYVVLDVKKKFRPNEVQDAETSIHNVIKECPRIFLMGDAGSGKTTLLKWIAVRAASGKFPQDLQQFNSYIPFFIKLRNFTDKALPSPQDFPALSSPAILELMPKKWVHEKLMAGKAFVLIDGLDEVSQAKREDVRQWLIDLMGAFPNARYILSSRLAIMTERWNLVEKFEEVFLQPMTDWAVDMFIDKWHAAVQELLDEPSDKQQIPSLAQNLRKVIRDNQRIFGLAKTPLLCALICALHRDRKKQLPKDRIELYDACTQMLVERREKERGSLDYKGDYPQLSYRQKMAILRDCAYWFMKNNWSSVEISRIDQHITNKLQNMGSVDQNVTGADVRRYFVERSGILRELSKGSIDFTHRTFQEFLAAQEVLDQDDIGLLIQKALENPWSEVIVLAAGLASQKVCDQILSKLIELGDKATVEQKDYQYYLLVAACMETVVSISPKVKQIIDQSLSRLIPPNDPSEARKWASAGDIAIPYLMEHALTNEETAVESIRAVTMISSTSARQALVHITQDERDDVLRVIVEGWGYFDREEYAREILSKNSRFMKYIDDVPDTQGLRYLSYLSRFTIKNGLLTQLEGLEDLNFRHISLFRCHKLTDIEALSHMTEVNGLILAGCINIKSIEPLRKLPNLQLLDLSLCEKIEDISPLAGMNNLAILSLCGCNKIRNFSALSSLRGLQAINLAGCNISGSGNVDQLRMRQNTLIYDFSSEVRGDSGSNSVRPNAPHLYHYTPPQILQDIPMDYYVKGFAMKIQSMSGGKKLSDNHLEMISEYRRGIESAFEVYKPGYSEDYRTAKQYPISSDFQSNIPYPAR